MNSASTAQTVYNVGDYRKVVSFGDEYPLVQVDDEVMAVLETVGVNSPYAYLFVKYDDGDYLEVWGMNSADLDDSAELLYSCRDEQIRFEISYTHAVIGTLAKTRRWPKQRDTFIKRVYADIMQCRPKIQPQNVRQAAIICAFNYGWVNVACLEWNGIERDDLRLIR